MGVRWEYFVEVLRAAGVSLKTAAATYAHNNADQHTCLQRPQPVYLRDFRA
jgi:hypothetical protein